MLVRAPPASDQPENWRVAGPRTGGHQPEDWTGAVYFLTWTPTVTRQRSERLSHLRRAGGQLAVLESSGYGVWPLAVSWPRSVRGARPHGVRGRSTPPGSILPLPRLPLCRSLLWCLRAVPGCAVLLPLRGVSRRSCFSSWSIGNSVFLFVEGVVDSEHLPL